MDESAIKAFIEETFTWLHSHPELSYEEHETTAQLKKILSKERIRLLELPLATGAAAEIGDGSKPVIALRADIDALPIGEIEGRSYGSENKGVMHACGHDAHTAMLLGAAKILAAQGKELSGTVRFLFQPAEEIGAGGKVFCQKKI